jgi:tRNA (mo5U34)-methyltransferase
MNIKDLSFWHSIQLPDGTVTPGQKSLELLRAEESAVLEHCNFLNKTVLDVGAWDGYFSFAAERHGASRVVASDWHSWVGDNWGNKASFDFVKNQLNSNVDELICKAEELPTEGEKFDIVLLLGVTYHVKNPIALIERVSKRSIERVVIETEYRDDGLSEPVLYLIPDDSLNNDNSNWNVPNFNGVKAMMEMAGLKDISITKHPIIPERRIFASGATRVVE